MGTLVIGGQVVLTGADASRAALARRRKEIDLRNSLAAAVRLMHRRYEVQDKNLAAVHNMLTGKTKACATCGVEMASDIRGIDCDGCYDYALQREADNATA